MARTATCTAKVLLVERRSIGHIPEAERHGNLRSQVTLWFGVPFVATGFYTGAWVAALGGVDISWVVGIAVPGALYYVATRVGGANVPERLILPEAASGVEPR